MPKNISFALTTQQILSRTKTVTRRFGWAKLQPGTILQAVEKGMGLKRGEKAVKLCLIKVKSVKQEPLNVITKDELIKEGFPDITTAEFIKMIMKHYNLKESSILINRIEFEYL